MWIGTVAKILSNIRVGKGAIVGAGCVVSKNIPPYAIVIGNPQKIYRHRFSEEKIEILLKIDMSLINEDFVRVNLDSFYTSIDNIQFIEKSLGN